MLKSVGRLVLLVVVLMCFSLSGVSCAPPANCPTYDQGYADGTQAGQVLLPQLRALRDQGSDVTPQQFVTTLYDAMKPYYHASDLCTDYGKGFYAAVIEVLEQLNDS